MFYISIPDSDKRAESVKKKSGKRWRLAKSR
jgi:hypothetical protein